MKFFIIFLAVIIMLFGNVLTYGQEIFYSSVDSQQLKEIKEILQMKEIKNIVVKLPKNFLTDIVKEMLFLDMKSISLSKDNNVDFRYISNYGDSGISLLNGNFSEFNYHKNIILFQAPIHIDVSHTYNQQNINFFDYSIEFDYQTYLNKLYLLNEKRNQKRILNSLGIDSLMLLEYSYNNTIADILSHKDFLNLEKKAKEYIDSISSINNQELNSKDSLALKHNLKIIKYSNKLKSYYSNSLGTYQKAFNLVKGKWGQLDELQSKEPNNLSKQITDSLSKNRDNILSQKSMVRQVLGSIRFFKLGSNQQERKELVSKNFDFKGISIKGEYDRILYEVSYGAPLQRTNLLQSYNKYFNNNGINGNYFDIAFGRIFSEEEKLMIGYQRISRNNVTKDISFISTNNLVYFIGKLDFTKNINWNHNLSFSDENLGSSPIKAPELKNVSNMAYKTEFKFNINQFIQVKSSFTYTGRNYISYGDPYIIRDYKQFTSGINWHKKNLVLGLGYAYWINASEKNQSALVKGSYRTKDYGQISFDYQPQVLSSAGANLNLTNFIQNVYLISYSYNRMLGRLPVGLSMQYSNFNSKLFILDSTQYSGSTYLYTSLFANYGNMQFGISCFNQIYSQSSKTFLYSIYNTIQTKRINWTVFLNYGIPYGTETKMGIQVNGRLQLFQNLSLEISNYLFSNINSSTNGKLYGNSMVVISSKF